MVINVEQALDEALLAMRMLRKSIVDHGHLEAMADLDAVMANAIAAAEQKRTEIDREKSA
ncbi:hypothetical protein [Mesorhizobium humile]|uniref:Uncharacterized protein n=1 Tax=Mesorhizobium humile TaxID=3072313 RepID=A0ABU4YEE5_9HYPH|nr:hypothetical protein [Mesorhizobium sp. VK2B]MDX8460585.1 hypothetical protein [Mesorhizobium sp. VK2D]MDX8485326.1 hypothetical protein [Mesorhizobium sp. VK2B]